MDLDKEIMLIKQRLAEIESVLVALGEAVTLLKTQVDNQGAPAPTIIGELLRTLEERITALENSRGGSPGRQNSGTQAGPVNSRAPTPGVAEGGVS